MTEPGEQPASAKHTRSLTGFYVVLGVIVACAIFGSWFWKTWTVWWFDADEARSRQAAAAARLGLPIEKAVDLGSGVKLELVLIPGGRFQMGSPMDEKYRRKNEAQHWVVITKPFYAGKCEVTQEQWEKVMGTSPAYRTGAKEPVGRGVSWEDCQQFLTKLNGLGLEKARFRLPTEAEWEWACRAGTRTHFCSGDTEESLVDFAWFDAGAGYPGPVGMKKPNAWGLHDLHGSVWEWCGDWYGEYSRVWPSQRDPDGPSAGSERVLRGGSSDNSASVCRSANRWQDVPAGRSPIFGFRVLMSVVVRGTEAGAEAPKKTEKGEKPPK